MNSPNRDTRVAIIGASGIGRHHGKWWALEGAEVCAFAGTSQASVEAARSSLNTLFGFSGKGYCDVAGMLEKERPDIVDVCSPPHLHFTHCLQALEAGCHVLCEKPFVHDSNQSRAELVAQAGFLLELAGQHGLRLGVCTQYSLGARLFGDLWREQARGTPLRTFASTLASPAKGRAANPTRTWHDLSPHPISMLLELAPSHAIEWDTLAAHFHGHEATARFRACDPGGGEVDCTITTRNTEEQPHNIRQCEINGWQVSVEGAEDSEGVYCARIRFPGGQCIVPDLMHSVIAEFLQGRIATDGRTAIRNLDTMLRIQEYSAAAV